MCGIVGYLGNYSKESLYKDVELIKHRGPDDTKFIFEDIFGYGFVRLSIIDIAGGQQPLFNETKNLCLICNGEIYNYKYLRNLLIDKGHIFSTQSDIEIIIHLYEEYGYKCIDYLEGMYAFSIYDNENKILILGRDHIGIKPLFYKFEHNYLKFGSELKLFEDGVFNDQSIIERNLFGFILNTNATIYENIKQVSPGCILQIDLSNKVYEYKSNFITRQVCLEDALFKAVETHLLNSDVSVGIALSGGLDSSLIAVISKEINKDIQTFTAYDKNMEDVYFARLVANKYNINHNEIKLSLKDLDIDIYNVLDGVIDINKSCTFDTKGDIVVYLFYKQISKYVKVLLSGDGGDELFGGYWMHAKPLGYKDLLNKKSNYKETSLLNKLFPENDEQLGKKNVLDILFYSALPNYHLWTLDRCSMKCGVEARVPYLDVNVINSVLNNYNTEERQGKKLLYNLYKKYLPKELIERKKMGFCDAITLDK
jgi:asparagine synthase (glutamine-hydrolysing)